MKLTLLLAAFLTITSTAALAGPRTGQTVAPPHAPKKGVIRCIPQGGHQTLCSPTWFER